MKTTSSHAHVTTKALLHTTLKEGDEWYAVTKQWYTYFEHFAYFDAEYDDNEADYHTKFENRELPPSLNDTELRDTNNAFELKCGLNENEHFVWIKKDLYQYFVEWFGVDEGSLSFKREVVNIGNDIKNELIIETYPLFICYVLCGNSGEADITTKCIIPISYHHNLHGFIAKTVSISFSLDDNDDKSVRIWRRELQNIGIEEEWDPFPADDHDGNEPKHEWRLMSDAQYNIAFGEWALNVDLSSDIHYMIETKNDNGNWMRNTIASAPWREVLSVGTKIDIYDTAYSKWYQGEVVAIDDGDDNQIKVHYDGYSSNYDEHMDRNSDRIETLNKHTAMDPFWSDNMNMNMSMNMNMNMNYNDSTPPLHRGCVGLRNLGNTCFMNSTIQCLSHCPLFVPYFLDKDRWYNEINRDNALGWKGKVAETWSQLLSDYWCSAYSVISPHDLKRTIAEIQPRFSGFQQHDSSELLQFLLDGLHEDLNRIKQKPYTLSIESNHTDNNAEMEAVAIKSWSIHKMRNDSIIVDYVQGQLKSRVECPDCNRISVTFDPFMFLSVPIPTQKKYIRKSITVIHLDLHILPRKYALTLQAPSCVSDLKDQLEAITQITRDRLVVTDVWSHHIYTIYKNYLSIDELSNGDHIICYQVPTDQDMKDLMNIDMEIDGDIKFKIVPIYHQINSNSNDYYKDLGVPLLIKLPLEYDIDTALITEYITALIEPYIQNMDRWEPCTSQDSDEDTKQLLFDSSSEEGEEGQQGRQDAVIADITADDLVPFAFVLLDKYGKSCGKCNYSAYCNGCNLNTLPDSKLRIADSQYESISIGIRWKVGAHTCFNHNAFVSPLNDKSVSESQESDLSNVVTADKKTVHLSECIDEFVAEETLGKNDAWYCRTCEQHKEAKKKLDLYSSPTICIIHLKRFTQNGYFREKNDCAVKYPITGLDLSQWIQHSKGASLYDLFAVSIHCGSLGGGHYIAYAKNLDNHKWFEFDDSTVSPINESDVYTNSAYVLFYNKRDIKHEAIPAKNT